MYTITVYIFQAKNFSEIDHFFFGKLIWGSNRSALLLTNIKTQNTVFLSWPFQIGHNPRFRLNHAVFIPSLICTDRTTTVQKLEIFWENFLPEMKMAHMSSYISTLTRVCFGTSRNAQDFKSREIFIKIELPWSSLGYLATGLLLEHDVSFLNDLAEIWFEGGDSKMNETLIR